MSLCKTKLFVLVTAAEEVLLWEAESTGFLKRVVNSGNKDVHRASYRPV